MEGYEIFLTIYGVNWFCGLYMSLMLALNLKCGRLHQEDFIWVHLLFALLCFQVVICPLCLLFAICEALDGDQSQTDVLYLDMFIVSCYNNPQAKVQPQKQDPPHRTTTTTTPTPNTTPEANDVNRLTDVTVHSPDTQEKEEEEEEEEEEERGVVQAKPGEKVHMKFGHNL